MALLPTSLRAEFVYVANFLSNDVSAYSIGANGALTPVAGSPFPTGFPTGSYSGSVAVDILGRFVYVTNTGSNPAFRGEDTKRNLKHVKDRAANLTDTR